MDRAVAFVFGAMRLFLTPWCAPEALAKSEEDKKRNVVEIISELAHSIFNFFLSNIIGKQTRMEQPENTFTIRTILF